MVIRGRTRGNGRQLGTYLLEEPGNDNVQILDVNGRVSFTPKQCRDALLQMSLTSELTKSNKGLYHAQINPAYGEDARMSKKDWLKAADMLGQELALENQRRVIVLHTKKGRTHAHVVWERYDIEKGKMVSDSYSRLAQDRARQAMEQVFEMKKTPVRNPHRPEMKLTLTELWKKCKTGAEFVKGAKTLGYTIAAGLQRRPFMVIDKMARSFDLVRQLAGVKTKEVREMLGKEKLIDEKKAIEQTRKLLANDNQKAKTLAGAFAINSDDMNTPTNEKDAIIDIQPDYHIKVGSVTFKTLKKKDEASESAKVKANLFADNKDDVLMERERLLAEIRERYKKNTLTLER